MLKRKCATCGKDFEAQRSTAKYCKPSCRVRASQTKAKLVLVPPTGTAATTTAEMPPASEPAPPVPTTGVFAATLAELEQIGAKDTAMGQLALQHAAQLQFVPDTASGKAALSRELRQVLDVARAAASGGKGDKFDALDKRRRKKWEAASS